MTMSWNVELTPRFVRRLNKLARRRNTLRKQVKKLAKQLESGPRAADDRLQGVGAVVYKGGISNPGTREGARGGVYRNGKAPVWSAPNCSHNCIYRRPPVVYRSWELARATSLALEVCRVCPPIGGSTRNGRIVWMREGRTDGCSGCVTRRGRLRSNRSLERTPMDLAPGRNENWF